MRMWKRHRTKRSDRPDQNSTHSTTYIRFKFEYIFPLLLRSNCFFFPSSISISFCYCDSVCYCCCSSCSMFVSFGVCASHRLRYFCWFSSSTVPNNSHRIELNWTLLQTHNQCASLFIHAFALHHIVSDVCRSLYLYTCLCCVLVLACNIQYFDGAFHHAIRIRCVVIMCLSVAIRSTATIAL